MSVAVDANGQWNYGFTENIKLYFRTVSRTDKALGCKWDIIVTSFGGRVYFTIGKSCIMNNHWLWYKYIANILDIYFEDNISITRLRRYLTLIGWNIWTWSFWTPDLLSEFCWTVSDNKLIIRLSWVMYRCSKSCSVSLAHIEPSDAILVY